MGLKKILVIIISIFFNAQTMEVKLSLQEIKKKIKKQWKGQEHMVDQILPKAEGLQDAMPIRNTDGGLIALFYIDTENTKNITTFCKHKAKITINYALFLEIMNKGESMPYNSEFECTK